MAIGYTTLAEVIRGYLDGNSVADRYLDEELPHLPRYVRENFMTVLKLDLIHCRRKHLGYCTGDLNRLIFFFRHSFLISLMFKSIGIVSKNGLARQSDASSHLLIFMYPDGGHLISLSPAGSLIASPNALPNVSTACTVDALEKRTVSVCACVAFNI